ncbi:MAG: HEAT repeat domain-containing protein [Planctomycetaceae bacterium]|nr:HEAT repeat domain-containing protein [Planctomycetaceae bacterium]
MSVLGEDESVGVEGPPGFDVTLFADDDLAHDIFSLTTDSFGRVAVSGPGYVRLLVDTDGDGRADEAKQYADGPQTGAQGMSFYGRDLICSGDAGLIRYSDADGDDRADGLPEVFIKAKTGGEHDIHAIRQGPDGWWYLLAGNVAGIDEKYVTLPRSPVQHPQAGTLMRLKPDLSSGEIIAHGFRNPYDFDFHANGDLYTFDSDGERDISLPWYRPTRVFHVLPGSHAGWFSRSWKRPDWFFDMPPVVGAFGRGSPTGVVCYRHHQFPEKYRDALFVLDWTYGRVMAMPLARDGSIWKSEPEQFLGAVGQFGFAPTDAAVGPDGSLYVSVGGRGTRGGVYRIRWKTPDAVQPAPDELAECLRAPQPLSSWSRRHWEPIAARLGASAFEQAAQDERRPEAERVRAVEILTEKFGGVSSSLVERLAQSRSALVRARAAWSLGRYSDAPTNAEHLGLFLQDRDPLVVRAALESLGSFPPEAMDAHVAAMSRVLSSPDRYVRQTAGRILALAEEETFHDVAENAVRLGWQTGVPIAWSYALRDVGVEPYTVDIGLRILQGDQPTELKRDAARLIQIGLGDVGPASDRDAVMEGYACRVDLSEYEELRTAVKDAVCGVFPSGDASLDHELGRILGMINADDATALDHLLAQITPTSDVVADIHRLIITSRMSVERTEEQRAKIAAAIVGLEAKFEEHKLNRDSNWDERMIEMSIAQHDRDEQLPMAILDQPGIGAPGHVPFVLLVPDEEIETAISKFVSRIEANPDYRWTTDVVYLLEESKEPSVQELIRSKVDDYSIRAAVLVSLATDPVQDDRSAIASGLDSHDVGVVTQLLDALETLGADDAPAEQVALVRTLRRMGNSSTEKEIQQKVIDLLRRNNDKTFDGSLDQSPDERLLSSINGWSEWAETSYPDEWARQTGSSTEDIDSLTALIDTIDWSSGNANHGEQLYHKRSCAQCHGGRRALGPALIGSTRRFSRKDLFTAIMMPDRDVPPRYQATLIVTNDGEVYTGLVIYESVDGLVMQTGANQTLRFETDNIDVRRRMNTSLMPAGLLKGLTPNDLADLYAYLETLGAPSVTAKRESAEGSSE